MKSFLLSTQLGPMAVTFSVVQSYDVENLIRDRAYSQAMAARALYRSKNLNPNNLIGPRTLASAYTVVSEALPE